MGNVYNQRRTNPANVAFQREVLFSRMERHGPQRDSSTRDRLTRHLRDQFTGDWLLRRVGVPTWHGTYEHPWMLMATMFWSGHAKAPAGSQRLKPESSHE